MGAEGKRMQRYQVVVNGNTYTVTVKSLVGSTAIVDVDGWEFQVAISETDGQPALASLVAAASSAPTGVMPGPRSAPEKPAASVPPTKSGRKRANALEQLSPRRTAAPQITGAGVVSAHLPGLIIEITVKVGEKVKRGDVVCKMEAMKMVNEVRSPIDGVVKEILVKEQQNVLENQPLIVIE
jgi:biotin carboxyl carrier protein